MRIAVVGAGGVGGGYCAALAKAGADVTFIARRAHLAARKSKGLKVQSPRAEAFAAMCQKAGIEGVLSPEILTDLWMKFILLASNASIMALTRLPVGRLRDDPDIAPWFTTAYEEVTAVGRAAGVTLPADAVDRTLNFNRNAPPQLMASMAVDLLRGNRIELPCLSGKVLEFGKKHGAATPTHAFMYAALKPYIMGAPA